LRHPLLGEGAAGLLHHLPEEGAGVHQGHARRQQVPWDPAALEAVGPRQLLYPESGGGSRP
jgi:hypothetical protein